MGFYIVLKKSGLGINKELENGERELAMWINHWRKKYETCIKRNKSGQGNRSVIPQKFSLLDGLLNFYPAFMLCSSFYDVHYQAASETHSMRLNHSSRSVGSMC